MAVGIRHAPTHIGGSRIETYSGKVKEYNKSEAENVAECQAWYDEFIAQRRARGVPVEGYPVWLLEVSNG